MLYSGYGLMLNSGEAEFIAVPVRSPFSNSVNHEAIVRDSRLAQIKKALGISGVYTESSSWRYLLKNEENGAQIDLLPDRAGHSINLCEIKLTAEEFTIEDLFSIESAVRRAAPREKTPDVYLPTLPSSQAP